MDPNISEEQLPPYVAQSRIWETHMYRSKLWCIVLGVFKILKKGYGNLGDGVIVEILILHTLVPMDLFNACESDFQSRKQGFSVQGNQCWGRSRES